LTCMLGFGKRKVVMHKRPSERIVTGGGGDC
jgi:hypothetical protein